MKIEEYLNELKELIEENKALSKKTDNFVNGNFPTIPRLIKIIEKQREALEWYADCNMESSDPYCSVFEGWSYAGGNKRMIPGGTKAREALDLDVEELE